MKKEDEHLAPKIEWVTCWCIHYNRESDNKLCMYHQVFYDKIDAIIFLDCLYDDMFLNKRLISFKVDMDLI